MGCKEYKLSRRTMMGATGASLLVAEDHQLYELGYPQINICQPEDN